MSGDLEFGKIEENRYLDVIQHLRNVFFADEPLNKSLALCQRGEEHIELEAYCLNVLQQDMSYMATTVDTNEVVGVGLLGRSSKDTPLENYEDPKLLKIFKFITESQEEVEFDSDVGPGDIVDFKIISVDDRLRGKGVGGRIYTLIEKEAKDRGFKVLRAEATALFSQKILEKNGWESLKEVKYSEYPNAEEPLFKVEPPHEFFKVMAKRIN